MCYNINTIIEWDKLKIIKKLVSIQLDTVKKMCYNIIVKIK